MASSRAQYDPVENFAARGSLEKVRAALRQSGYHCDDGLAYSVADPACQHCPLVYVSKGFELLTGFSWDYSCGRSDRFIQPSSSVVQAVFNGGERARLEDFLAGQGQTPGSTLVTLLLCERSGGERFWNFSYTVCVEAGQPYVVSVHTELRSMSYMPRNIRNGGTPGQKRRHSRHAAKICEESAVYVQYINGLRHELEHGRRPRDLLDRVVRRLNAVEPNDHAMRGDLFVPIVGLECREDFLNSGIRACLTLTQEHLVRVVGSYSDEGVAFTVSDPTVFDCPVVYASEGFQELTDFSSDYACGRSGRIVQPASSILNNAFNAEERTRLEDFYRQAAPGGTLVSLLLCERSWGERFWNLIYMVCLGSYVVSVHTELQAHMPTHLAMAASDVEENRAAVAHSQDLLAKLGAVRHALLRAETGLPELTQYAAAALDFAGTPTEAPDHTPPCLSSEFPRAWPGRLETLHEEPRPVAFRRVRRRSSKDVMR
jgi:hypothetical protein